MNLAYHLLKADPGLGWSIRPVILPPHRSGGPSRACHEITLVAGRGAAPVVEHISMQRKLSLDAMLATMLAKYLPEHPVLVQYRRWHGHGPVALEEGALDNIGELVHTALRKLADSSESSTAWHAIHRLDRDDRVRLWDLIQLTLARQFEGGATPSRREVAEALRTAVIQGLRNNFDDSEQPLVRPPRNADQQFAMTALYHACKSMDLQEWMNGAMGYLVKDCEPQAAIGATAPI